MRRAAAVIAGVAAIVLAAALAWALAERSDLRSELASVNERLDRVYDEFLATKTEHRKVLQDLDDATAAAKRSRRRAQELAERASDERLELRRRSAVEDVVAGGQEISDTTLLRGDDYDLLVVEWTQGGTRSGVYVWRVGDGAVDLVYVVEPIVDFDSAAKSYVVTGVPGAEVEDHYEGWIQWVDVADVGDATGDGLPDIALSEQNSGSGGCGKVRLLQNLDGALRETYQRYGCDHGLGMARGRLVLGTAARPKGCHQTHGCGTRRTWMRWDGSAWVVEKVTRELY